MKKFVAGLVTGIIVMLSVTAFAETARTIDVIFGRVNLVVDGVPVDRETLLFDGTTYVPLRAAAEILGMEVDWCGITNTATLISAGNVAAQAPTTIDESVARQGALVFENEIARITFHGTETDWQGHGVLVFTAENRTYRILTFQSDAMSVDGMDIGFVMGSSTIAPQSTGRIRFTGREPFVSMTPTTITGNIRIIDMDHQPREERWDTLTVEFQNVNLR